MASKKKDLQSAKQTENALGHEVETETKQLEILNGTLLKILAKLDKMEENQQAMIELLAIDFDDGEEGSEEGSEEDEDENEND